MRNGENMYLDIFRKTFRLTLFYDKKTTSSDNCLAPHNIYLNLRPRSPCFLSYETCMFFEHRDFKFKVNNSFKTSTEIRVKSKKDQTFFSGPNMHVSITFKFPTTENVGSGQDSKWRRDSWENADGQYVSIIRNVHC